MHLTAKVRWGWRSIVRLALVVDASFGTGKRSRHIFTSSVANPGVSLLTIPFSDLLNSPSNTAQHLFNACPDVSDCAIRSMFCWSSVDCASRSTFEARWLCQLFRCSAVLPFCAGAHPLRRASRSYQSCLGLPQLLILKWSCIFCTYSVGTKFAKHIAFFHLWWNANSGRFIHKLSR